MCGGRVLTAEPPGLTTQGSSGVASLSLTLEPGASTSPTDQKKATSTKWEGSSEAVFLSGADTSGPYPALLLVASSSRHLFVQIFAAAYDWLQLQTLPHLLLIT